MSRHKVLLVDDDPLLLRVLHMALEAEGYEVLLASDGQTALQRVRGEKPEAVVLDVMMPVVDGWGVLEEMREMPDPPRTIALTGKAARRDEIKAWQLGVDEYVLKPFDSERLLKLLGEILHRTPADRDRRRSEALSALGIPPGG